MTTHPRRNYATIAASLVAGAALLAAPGASAKSPHQVDPLTMTPALNPSFAPWSCWRTGTGITCQGENDPSYGPEPSGIVCDGQDVYVSGAGHERMTRWHTADGRATKTRVQISYPGDRFTLSSTGAGPAVIAVGHWNRHYTYPVPGDLSSRVLTERGMILRLVGPDGILLKDVGTVEFAPGDDFGEIVVVHGLHEAVEPGSFDAAVCEGLG